MLRSPHDAGQSRFPQDVQLDAFAEKKRTEVTSAPVSTQLLFLHFFFQFRESRESKISRINPWETVRLIQTHPVEVISVLTL